MIIHSKNTFYENFVIFNYKSYLVRSKLFKTEDYSSFEILKNVVFEVPTTVTMMRTLLGCSVV
jgi:hypothetical protein